MVNFKFKDENTRLFLFQHRIMELYVKRNLGMTYFSNEYDEMEWGEFDINDFQNCPLAEYIVENVEEFKKDVLNSIAGFSYLIYVQKGSIVYFVDSVNKAKLKWDVYSHEIFEKDGVFKNVESGNYLDVFNKHLNKVWNTTYDINISKPVNT